MGNLIWRPIADVQIGDQIIGFSEHAHSRAQRTLQKAIVVSTFVRETNCLRISTDKGNVISSIDHPWLETGNRWRPTQAWKVGQSLRYLSTPVVAPPLVGGESWWASSPPKHAREYAIGYVEGFFDGDGTANYVVSGKRHEEKCYWRIAIKDMNALVRLQRFLKVVYQIALPIRPFDPDKGMYKLETWTGPEVFALLNPHIDKKSIHYKKGYLAGIFDAEGSHSATNLRIYNTKPWLLQRVIDYGQALGFNFELESYRAHCDMARLQGNVAERIRFFATVHPAISRKAEDILGRARFLTDAEILAIEPAGKREVFNLETTCGTFFADGFASHNCWARDWWWGRMCGPLSKVWGVPDGFKWQAPVVFDDVIEMVKNELLSKRWPSDTRILLCSTTDPYIPQEGWMRVTQRILELLGQANLPTTILTKAASLPERDFDLLKSMDAWFGVTMDRDWSHSNWHYARVTTLYQAHEEGIKTFVSLEPWIPGIDAKEIVADLAAVVDHWIIGRLNYKGVGNDFYRENLPGLIDLLERMGASYYIKPDLMRCLER